MCIRDRIKLIDFALSVYSGGKRSDLSGTPAYMAPEVYEGYCDTECDVWSCGVMLYYMTTATLPFNPSSTKSMQKTVTNDPLKFENLKVSLSSELKDLLGKMLEKRPDTRIKINEIFEHNWMRNHMQSEAESEKMVDCMFKQSAKSKNHENVSALKFAILSFVASRLLQNSTQDTLKFAELFRIFDTNRDGYITTADIEYCRMKFKNSECLGVFSSFFNQDMDKKISYTEFAAVALKNDPKLKSWGKLQAFVGLLNVIDHSGIVKKKKLESFLFQGKIPMRDWEEFSGTPSSKMSTIDFLTALTNQTWFLQVKIAF
eukprot:TRINITY_DN4288_c0_g1_i1.p1 TRINITY_DN4288_c0_g1~~TRINITY_DN4288_c0_g1_i1.p1  ORF type:complete len:336 (+),score=46.67 TRINITY_DN4288_c0_g1_i1:61-1008(+)